MEHIPQKTNGAPGHRNATAFALMSKCFDKKQRVFTPHPRRVSRGALLPPRGAGALALCPSSDDEEVAS
jgi:hypothetical protein